MSELDKKIAAAKATEPQEEKAAPINWDAAELRIKKVEEFQNQYAGKTGFNPFLWLKDNVWQLKARFESGERTPELYNSIMAIPLAQEPSGENLKVTSYKISDVLTSRGTMEIPKK